MPKYNNVTHHNTTQHNTAQHSTAQHSTAQHSTAQHNTAHEKRMVTFPFSRHSYHLSSQQVPQNSLHVEFQEASYPCM